jgi:type I restriction enzyme S subunit
LVRAGDILVSTVRPNLNAVAVVPDDLDGEIASTGFCVLRPNKNVTCTSYLFYRTISPAFVTALSARVKGANYPAVTDDDVREMTLPLPPLSEQHRVVEILEQADHLRRLRTEANTKAARLLPALFVKMFGDPKTNPMGWDVEPLGSVAKTSSGGTPATKRTDYYGGAIPWVKSGELRARKLMATEQTITEEGLRNSSAKWCEPGAILLAMYGATVGEVATLGIRATTNQAVCAIWPGDRLHRDYLAEFVRLSKETLLARRVGGAQPNISQEIIRELEVPLPPQKLQEQFASRVGAIESLLEKGEAADNRISGVFQTLVTRAFSGSLTEKWRDAHAAQRDREADKVLEGRT